MREQVAAMSDEERVAHSLRFNNMSEATGRTIVGYEVKDGHECLWLDNGCFITIINDELFYGPDGG